MAADEVAVKVPRSALTVMMIVFVIGAGLAVAQVVGRQVGYFQQWDVVVGQSAPSSASILTVTPFHPSGTELLGRVEAVVVHFTTQEGLECVALMGTRHNPTNSGLSCNW